jgi:hypothetical protein
VLSWLLLDLCSLHCARPRPCPWPACARARSIDGLGASLSKPTARGTAADSAAIAMAQRARKREGSFDTARALWLFIAFAGRRWRMVCRAKVALRHGLGLYAIDAPGPKSHHVMPRARAGSGRPFVFLASYATVVRTSQPSRHVDLAT